MTCSHQIKQWMEDKTIPLWAYNWGALPKIFEGHPSGTGGPKRTPCTGNNDGNAYPSGWKISEWTLINYQKSVARQYKEHSQHIEYLREQAKAVEEQNLLNPEEEAKEIPKIPREYKLCEALEKTRELAGRDLSELTLSTAQFSANEKKTTEKLWCVQDHAQGIIGFHQYPEFLVPLR